MVRHDPVTHYQKYKITKVFLIFIFKVVLIILGFGLKWCNGGKAQIFLVLPHWKRQVKNNRHVATPATFMT